MPSTDDDALLVDVGTTFLKVATSTQPARMTRHELTDLVTVSEHRGHWEWDGDRLVDRVVETIHSALLERPDITRVHLSTHMRGFAIEQAGEQLVYVPWQDSRSLGSNADGRITIEHLREVLPDDDLWASGTILRAQMPVSNAAHWLMVEDGPRTGRFHTLGSLILSRLVGRHVTHETMAAATGFYSVTMGRWMDDTIRLAGCSGLTFPEVVSRAGPVGGFVSPVGTHVSVSADIGDNQAAAMGAELDTRRAALISVGTAGLIAISTNDFARSAGIECRPFFGRYLQVVSGLPGGSELRAELERGITRELAEMLGAYREAVHSLLGTDHDTAILLSGGLPDAMPQLADLLSAALARSVERADSCEHSLLGLSRLSTLEAARQL